jgi:hypothetical protein
MKLFNGHIGNNVWNNINIIPSNMVCLENSFWGFEESEHPSSNL